MTDKYIVAYTKGETFADAIDGYETFVDGASEDNYREAKEFYDGCLEDEQVHICSLTKIIESTDY